MINPISSVGYYTNYYPAVGSNAIGSAVNAVSKVNGVNPVTEKSSATQVSQVKQTVCQTCKSRKYVDKSNESVSYKTPTHISPEASFSAVSAHEGEHVANAISKGSQDGNELVSSSVSLKMEVCPECGKPYIAGGVTTTQIRYNESNPYERERKSAESSLFSGMNIDYVA